MSFLSKSNDSQSLNKESQSVLSVFRETISNLANINKRAEEQEQLKLEEAEKARVEAEQCALLRKDNEAIINNIENILN